MAKYLYFLHCRGPVDPARAFASGFAGTRPAGRETPHTRTQSAGAGAAGPLTARREQGGELLDGRRIV